MRSELFRESDDHPQIEITGNGIPWNWGGTLYRNQRWVVELRTRSSWTIGWYNWLGIVQLKQFLYIKCSVMGQITRRHTSSVIGEITAQTTSQVTICLNGAENWWNARCDLRCSSGILQRCINVWREA